jgi:hypothetical protein
MSTRYAPRNGKPQPGPFGPGREKWVKKPRLKFRGDAGAAVADDEMQLFARLPVMAGGGTHYVATDRAAPGSGLDCVFDQVGNGPA